MKKILTLVFSIFAFVAFAQDMTVKGSYASYTGTSADVISGVSTVSKTALVYLPVAHLYAFTIDIDTVAGTAGNTTVTLEGGIDGTNFTVLSTVTYTGTADTIIHINNFPSSSTLTYTGYRYYKVKLVGASGAESELQAIRARIVKL